MQRLKNKVCIVTGAAAGIGRQTATAFAEAGALVIAVDRDGEGLVSLAASVNELKPVVLDITNAADVGDFFAGIDTVDTLFNCAGMVSVGSLETCSEEDWERSVSLNMTSIFHMSRAAIGPMLKAGAGSIINMASVISSIGGANDRFAYGATKAAVIGMTKSIAKDYASRGIRCNAICPSAVETPSMTARIEAMDDPDTARSMFAERQPVGRMATPNEIADLAVYLASDESRFMTGSAIVIDGGAKL
ncbi:SDR family oxidoreductase [Pelagibius sp. Alg239-R121]|uniref:SDR family oxidoreductase n=1 Tax=Pelagibius sp. Alg239-R121 TaxID=2993448 RepID=UPI0024A61599|nr:SDR family oxidoreductase [Pelagibius sp. Alg239-R121]